VIVSKDRIDKLIFVNYAIGHSNNSFCPRIITNYHQFFFVVIRENSWIKIVIRSSGNRPAERTVRLALRGFAATE
jgi:hypothetical protein